VDAILDRHRISRMKEAIGALEALIEEWLPRGTIPEADWARLRSLEFQEILRARDTLAERLKPLGCVLCNEFHDHVSHHLSRVWSRKLTLSSIQLYMPRRFYGRISQI
jgi:antiviral helicase SKI2